VNRQVGEFGIRCPDCGAVIPVALYVDVWADEVSGVPRWALQMDDADVFAHVWSHDPELADLE
jgi:hypothetical protein